MKNFIVFLTLLASIPAIAQDYLNPKYDQIWTLGARSKYGYNGEFPIQSFVNLAFKNGIIQIDYDTITKSVVRPYFTCTSVCDSNGSLVATYNGAHLGDHRRQEVSLKPWDLPHQFYIVWTPESKLFPWPGHPGRYALVDLDEDTVYALKRYLSFARINAVFFEPDPDSSLRILQVDTAVFRKAFAESMLTTRHANGRDWWIIAFHPLYREAYFLLLDPRGLHYSHTQDFYCPTRPEWNGTEFVPTKGLVHKHPPKISPDGNWMVFSRWVNMEPGDIYPYRYYMVIYSVDRCSGRLTFDREIPYHYPDCYGYYGEFTWSPDSKLLYWGCYDSLYQLDFHTPNPLLSRIAVAHWDTIPGERSFPMSKPQNGWDWQYNRPLNCWGQGEITPDGRILIGCGEDRYFLHLVEQPNVRGVGCNPVWGALKLPDYTSGFFPAMPPYRLGPIDGSPCDSLGLDDPLNTKTQHQTDDLVIYPNPAHDRVFASMPEKYRNRKLLISDLIGNTVYTGSAADLLSGIDLQKWTPGVYFVLINNRMAGKFVLD